MLDNLVGETKIVFAMKSWNLPAFCHVVLIRPRRLRILSPTGSDLGVYKTNWSFDYKCFHVHDRNVS